VPEAARDYLNSKDHYDQSDLLEIAKLQRSAEIKIRNLAPTFLIADTGMLVLSIWHKEKYGEINSWIEEQRNAFHYDITLLCFPDLPWVSDPHRENPTDRDRLFGLYQSALEANEEPYLVVRGEGKQRINQALDYMQQKGHITR
jgi:nicotinamide riboside kinase